MGNQPMPSWAMYAEAMNKFSRPATAFMEHVHLLTEARTAYQEAMAVGTELRNRLDAGDKSLLDLMTQLEQVVSARSGEPPLDGKKPELVRGENVRTNSQATGIWKVFPMKKRSSMMEWIIFQFLSQNSGRSQRPLREQTAMAVTRR